MSGALLERMRNVCGWRSGAAAAGAKRVSIDAVIPIIAVPAMAFVAAQSVYLTILVFSLTPVLVYHLHHNFLRFLPRSKFFFMWTITSVLVLGFIFELSVVPLLEILPEENVVFIASVTAAIGCGLKTRLGADGAQHPQEGGAAPARGLELGDGSGHLCAVCRRRSPPKAHHCRTCQTCILGREYHCRWLDCCVGSANLRWYLGCLFSSAIAFIYGSNLTMTSVCHPFVLVGTILLPDNCSDVYHQLDLALCFVSAIYSLLIGLAVLSYLVYHCWLLYLGTTSNERRLSTDKEDRQYAYYGMLKSVAQLFCCKT